MDNRNFYDVAVIGGGPAGLTAALYLARARYRVIVVEKDHFGGQITITSEVVNYPGVGRTSGKELTDTMRRQAQSFGAEFLLTEVTGLDLDGDVKKVYTGRGELSCFGVLLATGAHPRMVGFEGEEEFRGHGVAYCATCDGEFFTGKDVFVVGGGFAAAEESVFLTKYAKHVTILIRGEDFTCAKAAADAARGHEKITVLTNVSVERAEGDSALRMLRYRNRKTGEVTEYRAQEGDTFGVFVFAGYEPATDIVKGLVELNEQGYVVTDRQQKTNVDGVYAAGDVCIKNLRQVVTAVGDGALAATELERYAAAMQKKTGRKPELPAESAGSAAGAEAGRAAQAGMGAGAAVQSGLNDGSAPQAGTGAASQTGIFSEDILAQLRTVFSRMERPLVLKLALNSKPVSAELKAYMEALAELTDKISVVTEPEADTGTDGQSIPASERPCVRICLADGTCTGLAFHGVPGGHEFTSFVLGLYNASGPGQTVDEATAGRISRIRQPVHMKIMVSLSCTMCPELVTSAQRIASMNENVRAEVYDLNHYPDLKERYQVMSVPCLVINDRKPVFGKKNIQQLLDMIEIE